MKEHGEGYQQAQFQQHYSICLQDGDLTFPAFRRLWVALDLPLLHAILHDDDPEETEDVYHDAFATTLCTLPTTTLNEATEATHF